jgi:hypothetical protein
VRLSTKGSVLENTPHQPGVHLTILKTGRQSGFSQKIGEVFRHGMEDFPVNDKLSFLRTVHPNEYHKLLSTTMTNITIASPSGGELDPTTSESTNEILLVVRPRGAGTKFIVGSKPGDRLPIAMPNKLNFAGPTPETPALMFGLGIADAPYRSMMLTRVNDKKYTDTPQHAPVMLFMQYKDPKSNYFKPDFENIIKNTKNNLTYQSVYSRDPAASNGIATLPEMLKQLSDKEANKMFDIIRQPNFRLYVSGIGSYYKQVLRPSLITRAKAMAPDIGLEIELLLNIAETENRICTQGTHGVKIRQPSKLVQGGQSSPKTSP